MFDKFKDFVANFFGADDVVKEDAPVCNDVDLGENAPSALTFSDRIMMPDGDVVFGQCESKIDGPFFWPDEDSETAAEDSNFRKVSKAELLSMTNSQLHDFARQVNAKVLVKDTKAKLVEKIMAVY